MKAANKNSLCAICEKNPVVPKYNPFCSSRCSDVDLGRWLKGNYVIPGDKVDVPDTDPDDAS
ncbi:MAG: DNA gyrase inhibitor YacG [Emcibacter sp.]|nr:DNA gyrase inhibitor YacG [Emcibacter sp.]